MTIGDVLGIVAYTVGWTLFGGVLGYLLGRITRDVHRVTNLKAGFGMVDDEPATPARGMWRERWHLNGRVAIGIVIVVLGVLTAVQGIVTNHRVQALQACQAHYSNQFADALDARTQASNGSQQALDALVQQIGAHLGKNTPADQTAIEQAISKYLTQRQNAKQERARHPLPPPPREACTGE